MKVFFTLLVLVVVVSVVSTATAHHKHHNKKSHHQKKHHALTKKHHQKKQSEGGDFCQICYDDCPVGCPIGIDNSGYSTIPPPEQAAKRDEGPPGPSDSPDVNPTDSSEPPSTELPCCLCCGSDGFETEDWDAGTDDGPDGYPTPPAPTDTDGLEEKKRKHRSHKKHSGHVKKHTAEKHHH